VRAILILLGIASIKLYFMIGDRRGVKVKNVVAEEVVLNRKKVVEVKRHTSKLDSLYIYYPNKRK
tara:strand:+ start:513 stop:707 length:195 start_codon:yes stop_codon:yes gene_type:complete